MIGKFNLPHIPEAEGGHLVEAGAHDTIWHHRNLVMGALAIFVYVGAEVAIGSFLVDSTCTSPSSATWISRTVRRSCALAARYISLYWGGAMVGRFVGSAVLQRCRLAELLGFNATICALLVCLSVFTFGHFAMWQHAAYRILQLDHVPDDFHPWD